jgi:uncharacterized protein (DUF3820 family)
MNHHFDEFLMTENTNTMTTTSNININKALVAAIAETKDIHADSTNPFHKSKYASLSAHLASIKAIFAKHGLAVLQFPAGSEYIGVGVTTRIIHTSGEFLEQTICIPVPEKVTVSNGTTVTERNFKGQDAGSLISYLRRYSLASVAGVATEDDDAELDRVTQGGSSVTKSNYIPNENFQPVAKAVSSASASVGATVAPNAFPIEDVADIESVLMPFGKNKGNRLVDLSENDWSWIVNKMELKPFNGKISKKDITLKNAARILLAGGKAGQQEEMDEVPF